MLYTKWGEDLDKSRPLPEYPRPQFVRDSYISLNGMWRLAFSAKAQIPDTYPYDICVPFSPESPLSGVNRALKHNEYLIYRRELELPHGFNKGRVLIHFGAVDQIAKVLVNGKGAGVHHGGYTPFTFDITDYLADGVNILNVIVNDVCEDNQYSRGKQNTNRGGIWYSPQSGIWQSVWLESVPEEYIDVSKIRITPDCDREQVTFDFGVQDSVEVIIYDGENQIADTTDKCVKIPGFKYWSPESPFLYKVVFKYKKDVIKSYFAMRKFSVGNDNKGVPRLFLNNKPYFHNGLLDQGYYPDGFLTPPSNEAMEYDVKAVKECGFNMLRKHIKIEPLLWYHYCDVNGIIVWQDMVNGGGKYGLEVSVLPFIGINLDDTDYKTFHRTDIAARDLYYKELKEMVDTLYNCPCIAMWVPFNEGWGQFDSAKAYNLLKKWDSTRIVDSASGWHDRGVTDVISKHIYFTPIVVKQGEKPWLLTEFGGLGIRVNGHTFNDKFFGYKVYKSKESITKAYKRLFEKTIIPQIDRGLSATVYTQVTDVEDELNGLMTYDRKVMKIDKEVLREINKNVKL
ncbi:MAG: glycoside hydrolase family 2 protein [Eubacterium sp.]